MKLMERWLDVVQVTEMLSEIRRVHFFQVSWLSKVSL
jgi:hypothetical protein